MAALQYRASNQIGLPSMYEDIYVIDGINFLFF
jgi:hypothetical protein